MKPTPPRHLPIPSLALLLATLLALTAGPAAAEPRTWTSKDGRQITGELVSYEDGKVTLRRDNGQNVTFDASLLSDADQAVLASAGPAGASAPSAATSGGGAASWPGWRGPDRNGHSPDTGLLKRWPRGGPERVWLYEDAGVGYSGPAIVDGKLYTIGIQEDIEEVVICLDANTGKELWKSSIGTRYTNNWGDGPRSTPTFSDGKLYCLGANGDLACLDAADGTKTWSKNLVDDLGGSVPGWGYTESPLVAGNLVIVTPGGDKGTLAAIDKVSGEVAWRSTEWTDGAQYSSPILIEHGGKQQVVQLVMKAVAGVDLENGDVLWKVPFDGETAVIPTPIYHDGHVYVVAGYGVGCKKLKLGDEAADEPEEVYKNNVMVNHHGGVVLVDGYLYGFSDGKGWVCQDWESGDEVWSSDDLGKGAIHYADGMLYCLDENEGTVVLAKADKKGWDESGRFTLDPQTKLRKPAGKVWVHPVVLNGKLYLRDQDLIYCYDVSAEG